VIGHWEGIPVLGRRKDLEMSIGTCLVYGFYVFEIAAVRCDFFWMFSEQVQLGMDFDPQ
jgi:hypothetical protein